jgi:hypothetical protein
MEQRMRGLEDKAHDAAYPWPIYGAHLSYRVSFPLDFNATR